MSELRPVSSNYDPGYPRSLTEQEIEDLLRPNLFRRFGKNALMAAGAVVAGIGLASAAATGIAQEGGPKPLPKPGLSTNKDAMFRAKVLKLAHEILGDKVGSWNAMSAVHIKQDVLANPPIKYPHIPISFGNSYVGIFDAEKARTATFTMFEQYGIKLEKNVTVKGAGYEFNADGFNKELGIGFEIVMPEGPIGFGPQKLPPEPAERKLDTQELKSLDQDIKAGKQRIFVVHAAGYPNMDGDLYTPMEYYLASVIDYLNWAHGDATMERDAVLGKKKNVFQPKGK